MSAQPVATIGEALTLSPSGQPYLSVSQVETAYGVEKKGTAKEAPTGCQFKWSLRYLHRIKLPKDGSAEVGTRVHLIAEDYLTKGTLPDLNESQTHWHKRREEHITYYPGRIFNPGIPFLPAVGAVRVEGAFKFTTSILGAPVWWQGAKDMEWGQNIGDHKSTASFTYQKKDSDLIADWQANLYGWEQMERLGTDECNLHWFTYLTDPTKTPECRTTRITIKRKQARDVVAELERQGRVLLLRYQEQAETGKIPELPKCLAVCPKYGGCGYRNTTHCVTDLNDLFGGTTVSNQYQNFLNDVDARVPGAAPAHLPVVTPPPVPPPAVRPAYWMPGDPLNETQQFLSQGGAKLSMIANSADVPPAPEVAQSYDRPASVMLPPPPPVPSVATPVAPPAPVADPRYDPATFARPPINPLDQINAPERPTVAPIVPEELQELAPPVAHTGPVAVAGSDDLDKMDRDQLKAYGMARGIFQSGERRGAPMLLVALRAALAGQVQNVDSNAQVSTVCPPAPVTHEVRTLPLTETDHMNGVSGRYEIVPPIPVAAPAPVFQETIAAGTFEDFGIVGIVRTPEETQPRGFSLYINATVPGAISLQDILQRLASTFEGATGVKDYKLVDYGKGVGLMTESLINEIEGGRITGDVVVDLGTREGFDFCGVLERHARRVVRAFR